MIVHPFTVTLRAPAHLAVDPATAVLYVACAVVVGFLTLRRPALGVAALLVLAPFDVARYIGPTTITTLKAGLVGMLATLAFSRTDSEAFRTLPVRAVVLAFGVVLLTIALSATQAEFPGPVAREGLKQAEYLLLFLGAVAAFATDPDDRPFWRMLELAVALVCGSALAEYVLGAHSGLFLHQQTVVIPRIAGALEGPNQLSGYLDVALPVLVARALVDRDRVLVAVIVLATVTDLLTLSRSGIIGAVIGVCVVLLVLRPFSVTAWRWIGLVTGAAAIAFGGAVYAGVPSGYFSLDQATQLSDHLGNRAQLWQAALRLWHTSPLFGIGAGNYELELPRAGLAGVRTHANSIYLQSLAETGILGLLATVGLFATVVLTLARSAVRRPLVVGALGATVALAVHQIFDDLLFFPKVGSVYWLVLGVATAEVAARRLFESRRTKVPFAAAAAVR